MKTTISFTLDTKRDADILEWVQLLPNKSKGIREALRQNLYPGAVTLDDIYREILDIKRHGIALDASAQQYYEQDGYEEPPDIAANLNNLGL
ncbi:MAG: hypothetical protein KC421_17745 [Anaerolineales bacterium]|nr:hypothetical protein [Anaerolineales bacterium]